jgi:hypothetical protein
MAQNYTRQSSFADGDTITASLFNNEYNQLVNAFTYSSTDVDATGHRHDGTSGEGGNIYRIGDLNFLNKIEADSVNNRWGFFVEVSSTAVEQIRIQDGVILPVITNDIDLGSATFQFKDLYLDGTANIDSLVLSSGSTVTAILDEDSLVSDSSTALATQQSIKAYVDAQVTAQDLDFQGDTGGALSIDLDSETLTIAGGTGIDTVGATNTLTVSIDSTVATLTGTQTLTNKTIDADNNTVSNLEVDNLKTGVLDTDISSVAGTHTTLPSALAVKTYVDAQVTAQDLDIFGDTGTDAIDLDSETLTFTGGTGITSVVTAGTVTHNIDSTVATLTGTQTLTNKTLTSPDINGGTVDGAVIGGTTAAAGSFTNITVSGTVDGRDVAADGTKLDGIEALADVTDTTNVTAAGALMDSELTNITAVKALNQGVATTDSPSFAGLTATTADINAGTIDGTVIGGSTAAAGSFTTVTASGEITANGGIALGDGDVATFGDSDDLSIFHAGGTTYLTNTTGSLVLRTDSFRVLNTANSEQILHGDANGAVRAYYDNAEKLVTTTTGIDVTGTVTADKVTIGTSSASNGKLTLEGVDGADSAGIYFNNTTATNGKSYSLSSGNSGEFMLYDRTSSAYRLFVSSAGNVGIGASSPAATLQVEGETRIYPASGTAILRFGSGGAEKGKLSVDASSNMAFETANSERMRIDASGNLGIGTSSPAAPLSFGSITNDARIYLRGNTNEFAIGTNGLQTVYAGYQGHVFQTGSFGGAERMRISAAGGLSVGTTVDAGAGNLLVAGVITSSKAGKNSFTGIDTTSYAAGVGGSIDLGGNYRAAGDAGAFTRIAAEKTNGVDNDFGYDLGFYVTTNLQSTIGTKVATMTSTGNVSIGTSSPTPSARLQVRTGTNLNFAVQTGTTDTSGIKINAFNDAANANIPLEINGSVLLLKTGETERARIDSSGNLLVGKTASAFGTAGIEARAGGTLWATASGTNAASFNRLTNDGDIAIFAKDGTAVGSIGTRASLLKIGTGDVGLLFNSSSDAILPENIDGGAGRDAAIDLGVAGARFKDLYLSGGVYLGGTGAANHLDDYEEGTWTPTFLGSGTNPTVTYATRSGIYTKVGNLVTCTFVVGTSANSGGVGDIRIGGLPFAQSSNAANRTYSCINSYNYVQGTDGMQLSLEGNTSVTYWNLLQGRTGASWFNPVWQTNATSAQIYFCGTVQYQV